MFGISGSEFKISWKVMDQVWVSRVLVWLPGGSGPSGESYPCKALSPNQSPLVSSLRCTGPWLSGSSWVTFTCVTSGQSERVSGRFTGVQPCLLPFRCWWWRTCLLSLPVWWCNRHPHSESEDTRQRLVGGLMMPPQKKMTHDSKYKRRTVSCHH